jgi:hypothetical protein
MKKRTMFVQVAFYLPDIVFLYMLYLSYKKNIPLNDFEFLLGLIVCVVIKVFLHFSGFYYFFVRRVHNLSRNIQNLKQGKFVLPDMEFFGGGYLSDIHDEIVDLGKHLLKMTNSQKDEIDKYREVYNNIIYSSNSYFLVVNAQYEVLFVNKTFCSEFEFSQQALSGRKIKEVFLGQNDVLWNSVESVKKTGNEIILQKITLFANCRSRVFDIKISRVVVQGESQIVMVMENITDRIRKEYQISLINQITESIQRDEEIDRILFSILTAVTSGSGLGFNRAMLFTYNEELEEIAGKMAVGPDSFEEAIQIWGAVQNENVDMVTRVSSYKVTSDIRGGRFYSDVVASRFPVSSGNILVKCMTELHPKHVYDSWNDPEVDAEFRKFIDVREFVAVPLVAGNKALGVIVADNRFNNTPISHENIELLSIFAMQAAFSMESFTHLSSLKEQMEKIKSRQSAIVESEKMAAVGRIAAHIAHEIRNPLATMGLYAKRILQTIAKGQKNIDSIKHGADVIKLEVERLEKILSNVMDFTRLDTYIKEYHSINDVAEDTYNLLKNLFQERKITADIRLAADLPLVKSDFNQLKQVMLNLIQNAMDASGENGLVQIETGLKDSKVYFAVKDTGKGISPENIPKLFEPFFTTKTNGVGLGLAVCKKIVTDHGGEILARNKEYGGAEFIVEFPVT